MFELNGTGSQNVKIYKWQWNNTEFFGNYSSAEADCPQNGSLVSTRFPNWPNVEMNNCAPKRF